MERKIVSKSGNSSSEGPMSTQALNDAKTWLEVLHDAEFRGRKDTDGAARFRLATRLGVKENYLFRLQYRAAEMKDVAGEVYRRLGLAYEAICESNEKAAAADRAERLQLRAGRDAVTQKLDHSGGRENQARD
jgi:hypothetical protein